MEANKVSRMGKRFVDLKKKTAASALHKPSAASTAAEEVTSAHGDALEKTLEGTKVPLG